MRFLLLNQFYPPDVAPTGRFLHDLARELVARGHAVHALAARAPYAGALALAGDEQRDGVHVRRVGAATRAAARAGYVRRGWRAAAFLARVRRAARAQPRPDLVLALSSPPLLGWAAVGAAARGARLVHWVMDAYPDVLDAHGLPRALSAALRAPMRRAYARAALVLTLGPFQARRVRSLVPVSVPVECLPLWGEEARDDATRDAAAALRRARGWRDDELVLLYSGNMGRGHRLADFLAAARQVAPHGPRFVFAGGGARRAEVEAFLAACPQARVELLPYADPADHAARLLAADVHLASLASAWQGAIVPSKVQAAFSLARPVIFVGPPDNESSAWVRASGGGWSCGEGDLAALLAALAEARQAPERARRGAAALAFAREHFDRARNLARLADLIESAAR